MLYIWNQYVVYQLHFKYKKLILKNLLTGKAELCNKPNKLLKNKRLLKGEFILHTTAAKKNHVKTH